MRRKELIRVQTVIHRKGCEKLETIIEKYFTDVFREDFFVVALDRTGCYLFTDCCDDEEVRKQLAEFLSSMSLTKEQVCLCVIGRKSKFNYCDYQHLSEYVLKAKQRRKPVLSAKELDSILQCYGIRKAPTAEPYSNFSRSGLYKELLEYRNKNGLPVSDAQLNQLCKLKSESQQSGKEFTDQSGLSRSLLDIVSEWEDEVFPEDVKEDFDTFVPPAGPSLSIEHRVKKFLSNTIKLLACVLFSVMCFSLGFAAFVLAATVLLIIFIWHRYGISGIVEIHGVSGLIATASKVLFKNRWHFIGIAAFTVFVAAAALSLKNGQVTTSGEIISWFTTAFSRLREIMGRYGI